MTHEPIITETYKDHTIEIFRDDYPENPREMDEHLGTMLCWHRRYNLGDKNPHATPADFQAPKGTMFLPLYLYDHSGLRIDTRSWIGRAHHAEWDSGRVGFIFVTREKIREEFGVKRVSKKLLARVESALKSEVAEYDCYLSGDVYGFVVKDEDGEEIDSCWGGFGDPDQLLEWAKAGLNVNLEEVEV